MFKISLMINLIKNKITRKSNIFIRHIKSTRLIDHNLESKVQEEWNSAIERAKLKGQKMWDNIIYRFESIEENKNNIVLQLSGINYSIRTSLSPFTEDVKKLGANEYGAKGCYSSIFIRTSDGKFVFINKFFRANTTNMLSFVGGIYVKDEGEVNNVNNLFDSAEREITEEIGVGTEKITSSSIIAIYESESINYCFVFDVSLSLTSSEVLDSFNTSNDGEAQSLVFIDKSEIRDSIKKFNEKDQVKFQFLNI